MIAAICSDQGLRSDTVIFDLLRVIGGGDGKPGLGAGSYGH